MFWLEGHRDKTDKANEIKKNRATDTVSILINVPQTFTQHITLFFIPSVLTMRSVFFTSFLVLKVSGNNHAILMPFPTVGARRKPEGMKTKVYKGFLSWTGQTIVIFEYRDLIVLPGELYIYALQGVKYVRTIPRLKRQQRRVVVYLWGRRNGESPFYRSTSRKESNWHRTVLRWGLPSLYRNRISSTPRFLF